MRVCVGQIMGAHGVRGLVKLASFTQDPEAIALYGPLTDEQGQKRFSVELSFATKSGWVARIPEVQDRDQAQALSGTRLFIERTKLPPADDEEFYHADLIGLRAELADGTVLGQVSALHNFGAGDMVEITLPFGKRPLLPFSRECVPVVDVGGGRIVIDPPAGLMDEAEATEGDAV